LPPEGDDGMGSKPKRVRVNRKAKDPSSTSAEQGPAPENGKANGETPGPGFAPPAPEIDDKTSPPIPQAPVTEGTEEPEGLPRTRSSPFNRLTKGIKGFFRKEQGPSPVIKKARVLEDIRGETVRDLKLDSSIDLGDKHVRVEIFLNPETSEYIYHSIEPILAPRQHEVMLFLLETLGKTMKYDKTAMETPEAKERFLQESVDQVIRDYRSVIGDVSEDFMDPVLYFIRREFIGYGRINSIMLDPGVEDISCDGTGIPVFVYHRDFGSIRTTITFDSDDELEGFVVSLAQRAMKNISVAEPILDATLPEGHRLNATFGREVTTRGSSFTIRKFKEDPLTISDLVRFGTISSEMAAHFWLAVQYGESIIFAGGTASGKTATMNAISLFIPTSAKIISIEDTREVNLPHQNWIAGITRGSADSERAGDIDMYQLLRAALRQRPEYVLVGEVRGKETMTMFQAMATGHITYSTMHADSVKSIVYRLENPLITIPRVLIQALNLVAIHNQLRVKGRRVRRITELVEIVGIEPTSLEIITNRVYKWEPAGDVFVFGGHSNLYERIMDMEDMTRDEVVIELNRRSEVVDWMVKNDVRQFKDVNTVVAEYYEDADKVVKIIRENPRIDISKGLHVFDEMMKERLPPVVQESLPPTSDRSARIEEVRSAGGA